MGFFTIFSIDKLVLTLGFHSVVSSLTELLLCYFLFVFIRLRGSNGATTSYTATTILRQYKTANYVPI